MSPEWMRWLEENMPAKMLEEFGSDWKHSATWRDNLIAKQAEQIKRLRKISQDMADTLLRYNLPHIASKYRKRLKEASK